MAFAAAVLLSEFSVCIAAPKARSDRPSAAPQESPHWHSQQRHLCRPTWSVHWNGDSTARDVIGRATTGFWKAASSSRQVDLGRRSHSTDTSTSASRSILAFDFSPGDRFTISAWVNARSSGLSYQAILVKAPPGGAVGLGNYYRPPTITFTQGGMRTTWPSPRRPCRSATGTTSPSLIRAGRLNDVRQRCPGEPSIRRVYRTVAGRPCPGTQRRHGSSQRRP